MSINKKPKNIAKLALMGVLATGTLTACQDYYSNDGKESSHQERHSCKGKSGCEGKSGCGGKSSCKTESSNCSGKSSCKGNSGCA